MTKNRAASSQRAFTNSYQYIPRMSDSRLHRVANRDDLVVNGTDAAQQSLVKSMKASNYGLQNCSVAFLNDVVPYFNTSVSLAAEEYLLLQGETYCKRVFIVERGAIEIQVDGKRAKVLRRGDVIAKHFIITASCKRRSSDDEFHAWLDRKDESKVAVKALRAGTMLRQGDQNMLSAVWDMQLDHANDILLLEAELVACLSHSRRNVHSDLAPRKVEQSTKLSRR